MEPILKAFLNGSFDLIGLKENVIIGRLIPAGTGLVDYKDISFSSDEEETTNNNSDEDVLSSNIIEEIYE